MPCFDINFSKRAEDDLYRITKYCLATFGEKTTQKIRDKIANHIDILSSNPKLGKRYYKNLRFSIQKYLKIVYRVNLSNQSIEIMTLFDTRQNPRQLKNLLKSTDN